MKQPAYGMRTYDDDEGSLSSRVYNTSGKKQVHKSNSLEQLLLYIREHIFSLSPSLSLPAKLRTTEQVLIDLMISKLKLLMLTYSSYIHIYIHKSFKNFYSLKKEPTNCWNSFLIFFFEHHVTYFLWPSVCIKTLPAFPPL